MIQNLGESGVRSGLPRADRVGRLAVTLMTLLLIGMLVRVAQLQIAPGARLKEHLQSRVTTRAVPSARGDILDRRYRYVATTEFGYRAVIDPVEFPDPPDEAILTLAEATGVDPAELGPKIISRMAVNKARAEARAALAARSSPAHAMGLLASFRRMVVGEPSSPAAGALVESSGASFDGEFDPNDTPEIDALPAIRYLVVTDVLSDQRVELLKDLKSRRGSTSKLLRGVHLEQKALRHYPARDLIASIVGRLGSSRDQTTGVERLEQGDLSGSDGTIRYVRDATGRPLWMGPDAFAPAKRGKDVRLSIDLEIQRIAHEELNRRVQECDAAGGRCVVIDPLTGEILAMDDVIRPIADARAFPWPDAPKRDKKSSGLLYDPPAQIPSGRYIVLKPDPMRAIHPELARNRCIEDVYEPGSTFKSFIWASATELGVYRTTDVLDTGSGSWVTPYGRAIHDVHKHAKETWLEVLIESSNIGMSQAADRMSFDQMWRAIRRFGFGAKTGVGLTGETRGLVTPRKLWSKYTQTSVSFGQEVGVTPVQMAQAFCAFARPGALAGTMPRARLTALEPDDPERSVYTRVLRSDVAALTRDALMHVAAKVDETMGKSKEHEDPPPRYNLFGKSGTAQIPLGKPPAGKAKPRGMGFYERQYNSSFIAGGPLEDPKLVVLVVIDDPGPELRRKLQHYGSTTAGPAVRRIMERSLAYLGVPPSPAIDASAIHAPSSNAD
jgi:cell division protein FtsI (penicillin-binding protein 3)